MASVEQIAREAHTYLQQHPNTSTEQVREHLQNRFLVSRDPEIAFLRSRLWPLALFVRFFRSLFRTRQTDRERIELVMEQLDRKSE